MHAALVGDIYAGTSGKGHGGEVADGTRSDAAYGAGWCEVGNHCCRGGSAGSDGGSCRCGREEQGGEDLVMLVDERRCCEDEGLTFIVMDALIGLYPAGIELCYWVEKTLVARSIAQRHSTPSYVFPLLSSRTQ